MFVRFSKQLGFSKHPKGLVNSSDIIFGAVYVCTFILVLAFLHSSVGRIFKFQSEGLGFEPWLGQNVFVAKITLHHDGEVASYLQRLG